MEGIFISKVSYIMIVCTISEVYIILIIKKDNKITFSKSDYVYPIEHNYIITSICSTSERRIFLGSQNDYLYELDYKVNESFNISLQIFLDLIRKLRRSHIHHKVFSKR